MSRKESGLLGDLDGYSSDFGEDEELPITSNKCSSKSKKPVVDSAKEQPSSSREPRVNIGVSGKAYFDQQQSRFEGFKNSYFSLNEYERHKKLINDYYHYYPATGKLQRDSSRDKRDIDIIRENHRFLWTEKDDITSWEKNLAKQYHDKLFKEYCICDLSKYKENKVALRWRIEKEVMEGKGQFVCGNKKCSSSEGLKSWEVNFAYMEESVKKNALVKLRLCPVCSLMLNYSHQRKEVKKTSKKRKHSKSKLESKKLKISESDSTANQSKETQNDEAANSIWKEQVVMPELKSREEEYDEYLDDLFF